MKQEESILKWASCVLSEPVGSLKAVQDVQFVKRLLWRIDDLYFSEWEWGGGQESFSQVLERMGRYFREEIGTDISAHLQGLNVYRNVREVWELLLGIAIKGNNRNNNISLIFEMDHSLQAELVKIVTDIIDKFGQETAAIEEEGEEEAAGHERQALVELAQENEVLREECGRLEAEVLRERQERAGAVAARKELEHGLEMMRLEKSAFLEVMANVNRSNSKIFEDGEGGLLEAQSNLSELAQDIVQFIRQQRKALEAEAERAAHLEEQVADLRDQLRRCLDENDLYLMKLGDLNLYEREIQALREELTQKEEWNLELIEQVSALEDEKANLMVSLQRRMVEVGAPLKGKEGELEEVRPYEGPDRVKEKRLLRKETARGEEAKRSFHSSEGERALGDSSYVPSEKDSGVRRQMEDELREPQLRNKLQREVLFLRKANSSLNRQIDALKRTNEALQRSAKSFLDSNQQAIGRWEQDYEAIIAKLASLARANEDLQQEKATQNQELAKMKAKEQAARAQESRVFEEENSVDSRSNSQISSNEIEIKINAPPPPPSKEEQAKREKAALWDEIVLRLREIVREGKTKQLAYESSLQALRNQNLKLLELLRSRNAPPPQLPAASTSEAEVKPEPAFTYFLNMQRVESEEVRDSEARPPPRLSYIELQEGEELEESAVSRLARQKSHYYGLDSRIVNEIGERRPEPSFINDDSFHLSRRATASVRESFRGLASRIEHEPAGSAELQRRMEEEVQRISEQYQRLNSNYQNVFSKLHIYTETLRERQGVKEGYEQVLQEISRAESEVKATREAEIVQLRLFNQALRQQLTESVLEKEEIAACIGQLSSSLAAVRVGEEQRQQAAFRELERVLVEAAARFNSSLKDPLAFLESCLEGSKQEGQLQKFYRLYIRERERTKQLNEEIELLSSVLLEYRNMILS